MRGLFALVICLIAIYAFLQLAMEGRRLQLIEQGCVRPITEPNPAVML